MCALVVVIGVHLCGWYEDCVNSELEYANDAVIRIFDRPSRAIERERGRGEDYSGKLYHVVNLSMPLQQQLKSNKIKMMTIDANPTEIQFVYLSCV